MFRIVFIFLAILVYFSLAGCGGGGGGDPLPGDSNTLSGNYGFLGIGFNTSTGRVVQVGRPTLAYGTFAGGYVARSESMTEPETFPNGRVNTNFTERAADGFLTIMGTDGGPPVGTGGETDLHGFITDADGDLAYYGNFTDQNTQEIYFLLRRTSSDGFNSDFIGRWGFVSMYRWSDYNGSPQDFCLISTITTYVNGSDEGGCSAVYNESYNPEDPGNPTNVDFWGDPRDPPYWSVGQTGLMTYGPDFYRGMICGENDSIAWHTLETDPEIVPGVGIRMDADGTYDVTHLDGTYHFAGITNDVLASNPACYGGTMTFDPVALSWSLTAQVNERLGASPAETVNLNGTYAVDADGKFYLYLANDPAFDDYLQYPATYREWLRGYVGALEDGQTWADRAVCAPIAAKSGYFGMFVLGR